MLKNLLKPFFDNLNTQNISYCVCGNYDQLPEYTAHDIDIWTEDVDELEKILFQVAKKNNFILYLSNRTANGSNNFFYQITNSDMEFVRIDILKECAWLSFVPIIQAQQIADDKVKHKNFYVAEPIIETSMHLLYPLINQGIVKEKYRDKIHLLHDNEKFESLLVKSLGKSAATKLINKIKLRNWTDIENNVSYYRLKLVLTKIYQENLNFVNFIYCFIQSNIKRLFKPSGLFIVFLGPDGCGKTTLINHLSNSLEQSFLKKRNYYWRPFILPRLRRLLPFWKNLSCTQSQEDKSDIKLTKTNKVLFLVKFIYYFLDYIIGRLKYQSLWSRGGLVIFDRYYYDHIVYPERFGFIVSRKIMLFFEKIIPKPDIMFFLYASPDTLIQRKQELSLAEIRRQLQDYDDLITKIPFACKIDTSESIAVVEKKIIKICLDYMSERL
jgi:thymidylate kinase